MIVNIIENVLNWDVGTLLPSSRIKYNLDAFFVWFCVQ